MSKRKQGQNIRLGFRDDAGELKYIAGALTFDLSIEVDTEESTTKDSTNGFKEYEPGLVGWSGSGQARLTQDAEDLTGIQGWDISDLVGKTLHAEFNETDGQMNRETVIKRKYGDVIITSWKITASNKETVNVDYAFQGTGELKNAPTITGAMALTATTTNQTSNYVASDGSAISAQVESGASWLTATMANNVLTYKASANTGAERSAHVTLTTASGAELVVTIKQEAAA